MTTSTTTPPTAARSLLLAAVVVVLASIAVTSNSGAQPLDPAVTAEVLSNGSFDQDGGSWWAGGSISDPDALSGEYCLTADTKAQKPWQARLGQGKLALEAGANYRLSFDVVADQPAEFDVLLRLSGAPVTKVFEQRDLAVASERSTASFEFTSSFDVDDAKLVFKIGSGSTIRYCFDNVSLRTTVDNRLQEVNYQPDRGDDIVNPERGWFDQQAPFWLGDQREVTNMADLRGQGVSLVRLYFLLDEYIDSAIDDEGLRLIEENFAEARRAGVKVVPRFAYNFPTGGEDYRQAQDATLARTLEHIDQLTPILRTNSDVIAYANLGFVGAWGEWHSSSNDHVSNDQINASGRQIVDAVINALPQDRMATMRYSLYKQQMFGTAPLTLDQAHNGTAQARIGHLNDCFLASDDDFGTYPYQDPAGVEQVKQYLSQENQFVVQGGETCNADERARIDCSTALEELERMRWSALHNGYNQDVLSLWQQQGCYDEVGRNLGYRFSLLRGSFPATATAGDPMQLQLSLENSGYAAPYNPRPVALILRNQATGSETSVPVDADPRTWRPGRHDLDWTVTVPAGLTPGDYSVLFHLPDAASSLAGRPDYAITLANPEIAEADTGYNDLGISITVR